MLAHDDDVRSLGPIQYKDIVLHYQHEVVLDIFAGML